MCTLSCTRKNKPEQSQYYPRIVCVTLKYYQLSGYFKMKHENTYSVGKGKFGHVSKDIWKNMPDKIRLHSPHPDTMPVAIKRPYKDSSSIKTLTREVAIHRKLSHPNIVAFLGVLETSLTGETGLVMELIPHGDLVDMLNTIKGSVPDAVQFSIARDIARGLAYLHDLNILHRDIKCENILLEKRGEFTIAKICDFGLATTMDKGPFHNLHGTPLYIAPELFCLTGPYPFSTKSDIYAFAILLWILTSKRLPFQEATSPNHLRQMVRSGKREKIPLSAHVDFRAIITDCWEQNPDHRPLISSIIERLTDLLESVDISLTEAQYPDSTTCSQEPAILIDKKLSCVKIRPDASCEKADEQHYLNDQQPLETVNRHEPQEPLTMVRKNDGLIRYGLFAGVAIGVTAIASIAYAYSSGNS